jgi:hypothetical protein
MVSVVGLRRRLRPLGCSLAGSLPSMASWVFSGLDIACISPKNLFPYLGVRCPLSSPFGRAISLTLFWKLRCQPVGDRATIFALHFSHIANGNDRQIPRDSRAGQGGDRDGLSLRRPGSPDRQVAVKVIQLRQGLARRCRAACASCSRTKGMVSKRSESPEHRSGLRSGGRSGFRLPGDGVRQGLLARGACVRGSTSCCPCTA